MLTMDKLRAWDAGVDAGLGRCLNNEAFYLRLVNKVIGDPAFDRLREACESGNLDQAFDAAHSLKGMLGNLSLTPVLKPVEKITELLRSRTETDYGPLLEEIAFRRQQLEDMA